MLQNHHFCTIIIVTVICTSNGLAENALINPHINLVGIMMVIFPGGGGRGEGVGVLPIMAHTGRLRPKGVPFSRFRYMKG